jgi:hypothetical protein
VSPEAMHRARVVRARLFFDGAQLTRRVELDVGPGPCALTLGPLPDDVQAISLSATATFTTAAGTAPARLLAVELLEPQDADAGPDAEGAALEEELARLEDAEQTDALALAHLSRCGELTIAAASQAWARGTLATEALASSLDALGAARAQRVAEGLARERRRVELSARLEQRRRDHARRPTRDSATRRVALSVSIPGEERGTLGVELTYVTAAARWRAEYELRRHEGPEPERARLTITALALVEQRTGEDWSEVELRFVGGGLEPLAPPPELRPWLIGAAPPGREAEGFDPARAPAELERVGPSRAGASELGAATAARLPSSDGVARVPLLERTLEGRLRLEVDAEERPRALLLLDVVNPFGRALEPGPVLLFRGSELRGRTELPAVPEDGRLRLPVDVEPELRVRRALLAEPERINPLTGAFTYDLERRTVLENVGKAELEVSLRERVPVSRAPDITVRLLEADRALEWDAQTGLGRGTLVIPPRSRREVRVTLRISAARPLRVPPPPTG